MKFETSIIGDSSGLFSLVIASDRNNKKAQEIIRILKKQNISIIVPGDVFAELINILGRKVSHAVAFETGEMLLNKELFTIIDSTSSMRIDALEKFKKQPESVSFTDCVVMAVADEYETKFIFGFDESFRKSGYRRIGIDKV